MYMRGLQLINNAGYRHPLFSSDPMLQTIDPRQPEIQANRRAQRGRL